MKIRALLADTRGAALVEMTLVLTLFLLVSFGVADAGLAYWQVNSAEKAAQRGVRHLIVSDFVASGLKNFDCGSGTSLLPGTSCSTAGAASFGTVTCSGASSSCSGGYAFSTTAFNAMLAEMQEMDPRIQASNVVVVYNDIGLGFVGRGSPVPSVMVRIQGLTVDLAFVSNFLGFGPIGLPDVVATLTAEDLNSAGA